VPPGAGVEGYPSKWNGAEAFGSEGAWIMDQINGWGRG